MKQANNLANNTRLLLQAFVVVSAIYIAINFALTRLATWLESRIRQRPGAPRGPGAAVDAAAEERLLSAVGHELPTAVAPR